MKLTVPRFVGTGSFFGYAEHNLGYPGLEDARLAFSNKHNRRSRFANHVVSSKFVEFSYERWKELY